MENLQLQLRGINIKNLGIMALKSTRTSETNFYRLGLMQRNCHGGTKTTGQPQPSAHEMAPTGGAAPVNLLRTNMGAAYRQTVQSRTKQKLQVCVRSVDPL